MAFTNEQLERYSRHIILKEVGVKGQKKLLNAKVLIIGAGGLGAPAAGCEPGCALANENTPETDSFPAEKNAGFRVRQTGSSTPEKAA